MFVQDVFWTLQSSGDVAGFLQQLGYWLSATRVESIGKRDW